MSVPSSGPRTAREWKPPAPRVVIVGGGLAGLAAAVGLADLGLRTTLLESRPRLGGRASSFTDPATGQLVDNCQHVGMACCTNFWDFTTRVGTRHLFRRVDAIRFLSPEGKYSTLRAGWLPAPLHLTASFLGARYLSWTDKLRVAHAMACLRSSRGDRPGESFADWLWRHGQTVRTINRYWNTVLVSALNDRPENMDVALARKVFLDGFLRNKEGYVMEVPLVPLGELHGSRLEPWLRRNQVEVRLTQGVRSVLVDEEGGVSGVALRSGETMAADFVVLAVPCQRVVDLLPATARARLPGFPEQVQAIGQVPITGVHLWFDRRVFPHDHVAVVGKVAQWIFDHSAGRAVEAGGDPGQYLQVVISASHDLLHLDKAAILKVVLDDLAEFWPATREASLVRSWVVTEHTATFTVQPGIEALRPRQRTAIEGLFLAGDWTATGWPSTMEGAVRSGYLAAEGILSDLGRPKRLLRPDLPPGRLARWLLGPSPGEPLHRLGFPPAVPHPGSTAVEGSRPSG